MGGASVFPCDSYLGVGEEASAEVSAGRAQSPCEVSADLVHHTSLHQVSASSLQTWCKVFPSVAQSLGKLGADVSAANSLFQCWDSCSQYIWPVMLCLGELLRGT